MTSTEEQVETMCPSIKEKEMENEKAKELVENMLELEKEEMVEKMLEVEKEEMVEKMLEVEKEEMVEKMLEVEKEEMVEKMLEVEKEEMVEKMLEVEKEEMGEKMLEVEKEEMGEGGEKAKEMVENMLEMEKEEMVEKMLELEGEEKEKMEEDEKEKMEEEEEVREEDGNRDTVEKTALTSEKIGKKGPLPEKKQAAEGLNLNNEVVLMRKEVKRVRALVLRKMTRQISALKKKKGSEADLERNLRRAARLLEEIHAMRALKPDQVSKTALRQNLSFEKACKDPSSTIADRAMARIATHPQFSKKIDAIKAAVEAFKEERGKDGEGGEKKKKKGKVKQQPEKKKKAPPQPKDVGSRGGRTDNAEEGDKVVRREEDRDRVGGGGLLDGANGDEAASGTDSESAAGDNDVPAERDGEKADDEDDEAELYNKYLAEMRAKAAARGFNVFQNVKTTSAKNPETQDPASRDAEEQPSPTPAPAKRPRKDDDNEEESDLEPSDDEGEKEYFDDSTEERFRKQSSGSENSDNEDDFFLGKVSKLKKKKSNSARTVQGEPGSDPADPLQRDLDELESRLNSKAAKLQTVFCSSLSDSHPGERGQSWGGRGRGRGQYGGRGGQRGGGGSRDRFSNEPPRSYKQHRGTEGRQGFSNDNKRYSKDNGAESRDRGAGFAGRGRGREQGQEWGRGRGQERGQGRGQEWGRGRGQERGRGRGQERGRGRGQERGRGRGDMARQQDRREAPQQSLHPSWEASKKKKEQQGQIVAFQGKKIKFDD